MVMMLSNLHQSDGGGVSKDPDIDQNFCEIHDVEESEEPQPNPGPL